MGSGRKPGFTGPKACRTTRRISRLFAPKKRVGILKVERACVKSRKHGVYVQNSGIGLCSNKNEHSPCTINCEAGRAVMDHILEALQRRYAVYVTGRRRICKAQGAMMYAIQALLCCKTAVFYISY